MPLRYIVSHTSMRGVAALLVVFYHMQYGTQTYFGWEAATPFFKKGYLWVDLFFMLSGFVISYSARSDERAPFSPSQIKSFYVLRFARIYPLHVAALCMLLCVTAGENLLAHLTGIGRIDPNFGTLNNIAVFFEQLALVNAWGLTGVIGWNIPSWSISAEAVAYMLFPLVAALIAWQRWPILAALALGAGFFYFWIATNTGILDIVKGEAVLRCLAGFGLGIIIYYLRKQVDRLSDASLGALQVAAALIMLGTMAGGYNDVFAIPGFFLLVATTWPDRGFLARMLQLGPLHWLGTISYSVYLNHFWVLAGWHFVIDRVLRELGVGPYWQRGIVLSGGIILVLVVSNFSYLYIEGPARLAIVKRYAARPAAQRDRLRVKEKMN